MFIKLQLDFLYLDMLRNGTTSQLCNAVLCILACPDDNVVHTPQGLVSTIASLTRKPAKTIRSAIAELESRGYFLKIDEFSCQIDPKYMKKTQKVFKYKAKDIDRQTPATKDESQQLFDIYTEATSAWAARGKNKRYIKQDEDSDMIAEMKIRFDQQEEKLNQVLDLLKAMIKKEPGAEQKAECHLKLIEGGKE